MAPVLVVPEPSPSQDDLESKEMSGGPSGQVYRKDLKINILPSRGDN
jgi:hypothetical protein